MEAFESALGYDAASGKLHELFNVWLSQPETARVIKALLDAVGQESVADGFAVGGVSSLLAGLSSPSSSNSPRSGSPLKGVLKEFQMQSQPPRSPTSKGSGTFLSPRSFSRVGRLRQLDLGSQQHSPTRTSRSNSYEGFRTSLSFSGERPQHALTNDKLPTLFSQGDSGRGRGMPLANALLEDRKADIAAIFAQGGREGLGVNEFVPVTKTLCGFPSFFNSAFFARVSARYGGGSAHVTMDQFCEFWKDEIEPYDEEDRFFRLVKQPENHYLVKSDFVPYINELLAYHPGLEFLESHPDFHPKYTATVITRIFYVVNTSRSGRITLRELRRSNLVEMFRVVDEEEDINKVAQYFSYEHFYVLFCRFYELDADRSTYLKPEHLLRYGDHGLSNVIVDRIFEVGPRPFEEPGCPSDRSVMSYEDFVYFMMSEEDKGTEQGIRYWFHCCDVDGDDRMDARDMKFFYEVQMNRLESLGHEIVPYEDMICQMWDLLRLGDRDFVTLEDFLRPDVLRVGGILFDCLFNMNKFICFEQRDPFSERAKRSDPFESDWDRFAFHDYNRLAAEDEEERMDDTGIIGMDVSDEWEVTDDDEMSSREYRNAI